MAQYIKEDNPLGIIAIDHLEFTADSLDTDTVKLFYQFGFEKTYLHVEKPKALFSQGQIRFLMTAEKDPNTHSRKYFENHGEGVSTLSFLVEDCDHALKTALERGGELVSEVQTIDSEFGTYKTARIKGFGDLHNEFVERPNDHFRPDMEKITQDQDAKPLSQRVARIDHLTNNVPKGEMKKWVDFYTKVFGMQVTRYFDIKGQKTGLQSEVVQLASGAVIIPINEPDVEGGKSQIQEFLDRHKGAGVQHIALTSADIISTVGDLQKRGIRFLDIPATYYQQIPSRGLNVKEDLGELERTQLLVDGDSEGYLIQNFTDTYVGPLFFEFIQRKNHNGFGEGNFQALFDAIELDQKQRGYLE